MHKEYRETGAGLLLPEPLVVGGVFSGEIHRKNGLIESFDDDNIVVNQGLNALLNIMFNAGAQVTTWYLGLFEGNYTPIPSVTAATIASASTETTAYSQAGRPAFAPASAASQTITNTANRATFTFTASKTIYGAFLVSSQTKSGTSGTLFSATRFNTPKTVTTA
jgi:hypothetical protein